jgi:hypothetical protein
MEQRRNQPRRRRARTGDGFSLRGETEDAARPKPRYRLVPCAGSAWVQRHLSVAACFTTSSCMRRLRCRKKPASSEISAHSSLCIFAVSVRPSDRTPGGAHCSAQTGCGEPGTLEGPFGAGSSCERKAAQWRNEDFAVALVSRTEGNAHPGPRAAPPQRSAFRPRG